MNAHKKKNKAVALILAACLLIASLVPVAHAAAGLFGPYPIAAGIGNNVLYVGNDGRVYGPSGWYFRGKATPYNIGYTARAAIEDAGRGHAWIAGVGGSPWAIRVSRLCVSTGDVVQYPPIPTPWGHNAFDIDYGPDGVPYIFADSLGVYRWSGSSWTSLGLPITDSHQWGEITRHRGFTVDDTGRVWVAGDYNNNSTTCGRLWFHNNGVWTRHGTDGGLWGDSFRDVAVYGGVPYVLTHIFTGNVCLMSWSGSGWVIVSGTQVSQASGRTRMVLNKSPDGRDFAYATGVESSGSSIARITIFSRGLTSTISQNLGSGFVVDTTAFISDTGVWLYAGNFGTYMHGVLPAEMTTFTAIHEAHQAKLSAAEARDHAIEARNSANQALAAATLSMPGNPDHGKAAAVLAKEAKDAATAALNAAAPHLHRVRGLNGATATTTSSFSVVVDASGATEFRARREGGVWTGWTSVNNPVSVPDLIAGANTIQAEVRNAAGATATGRMIAFRL